MILSVKKNTESFASVTKLNSCKKYCTLPPVTISAL